jgi:hypothetical protein
MAPSRPLGALAEGGKFFFFGASTSQKLQRTSYEGIARFLPARVRPSAMIDANEVTTEVCANRMTSNVITECLLA